MSNPVSNADVEDVLESIRRLVSEHRRPPQKSVSEAEAEEQRADDQLNESAGRLVLTESQLVETVDEMASQEGTPEHDVGDMDPFVLDEFHKELDANGTIESVADSARDTSEQIAEAKAAEAELDAALTNDAQPGPAQVEEPEVEVAPEVVSEFVAAQTPEPEQDALEVTEPDGVDETATAAEAEDETATAPDVTDTPDEVATAGEVETLDAVAKLVAGQGDSHAETDDAPKEEMGDSEKDPEKSDALDQDTLGVTLDAPEPEDEASAPAGAAAKDATSDPFTKEEVARIENRAARQMKLGAKIAALEAVIGRRDDQWEPDGVDQDAYSGTVPPSIDWEDREDVEPEQDADVAQAELVEDEPAAEEHTQTVGDNVTQMGIPMTVFRHASEVMPVRDTEQDDVASESSPVIEMIRQDAQMPSQVHSTTDLDTGQTDLANDLMIDEDALRVLVADIVREELQGPLGERITRNVRKLVRREIHRAMTSREFE